MKSQPLRCSMLVLCGGAAFSTFACDVPTGRQELLTVLNPKSWVEPFHAVPLNPRPDSLSGKTIVVMVDPAYKHGRETMVGIKDGLEKRFPDAKILWVEEEAEIRKLEVASIDGLAVGAGT